MGPIGISKSATASRNIRDAEKRGEFEVNKGKENRWRSKILNLDAHAEFYTGDVSRVRHSRCGKDLRVKEPYDTTRFAKHVCDCKGAKKTANASGGTYTLVKMAKEMGWNKKRDDAGDGTTLKPRVTFPCPGLTEDDSKFIPIYLRRTSATGGGARSVAKISMEMFGIATLKGLSPENQHTVLDSQFHEQQWRNDHANIRVFSTQCNRITQGQDSNTKRPLPCTECKTILNWKRFTEAIEREPPSDKNYKYVNHRFRNQILGENYGKVIGLRHIIESAVSGIVYA
jgi:hypothetical protein